ncbi:MAG TPA: sugar phosphate isomerase/epimerase, partial [archaeon]|nr:sugar phosphate isomerase/epimerase [archaeon]
MTLVFGTAPDSWGVWLAEHPSQPSWKQFLDESAATGHRILELGPYGYLPTDGAQLKSELEMRGQSLIAATMVATSLHKPGELSMHLVEVRKIAKLAAPLGAKYLVLMIDSYRGSEDSKASPASLAGDDWAQLVRSCDAIGKLLLEEFGMVLAFHPHADSVIEYSWQVNNLLDDSDPRFTQLCLDTGHYRYRDGDSAQLMRERYERIPYLHLKSVDPVILRKVNAENLSFGDAVNLGVVCEPAQGAGDFAELN